MEVCGRKMGEKAKIQCFLGKTLKWYRYQRVVPVPMMQWASGTGTTQTGTGTSQSGTGTTASCNLKLAYFCTVKSRIRTRLFRNPKKQLMGVQIGIKLSEKRTVPRRLVEANVFGQP